MRRDFTYIDDIVEGVIRTLDHVAAENHAWSGDSPDPATSRAPYRLYNIGNHSPVELMRLIEVIEEALGRKAVLNFKEMQPGDVPETYADVADLMSDVSFTPSTPIETGVKRFVEWYGSTTEFSLVSLARIRAPFSATHRRRSLWASIPDARGSL